MRNKLYPALAVLALAAVSLAAQEGVLLRLKLKPDSTDRYKMSSSMKQSVETGIMPTQESEITSSAEYILTYGKLGSDGKAAVTVEIKDLKLESTTPLPAPPSNAKVTGKVDERYQLFDMKAGEGTDAQLKQIVNNVGQTMAGISLPEKSVKSGDTFELILPKNPALGDLEIKLKAKFDGEKKVDGKDYYVVSVNDSVPIDIDISKVAEANGQPSMGELRMKGTLNLISETLYEKDTLRLFSNEATASMDAVVPIPQVGAEAKVKNSAKTSIKLAN